MYISKNFRKFEACDKIGSKVMVFYGTGNWKFCNLSKWIKRIKVVSITKKYSKRLLIFFLIGNNILESEPPTVFNEKNYIIINQFFGMISILRIEVF